MLRLFSEGTSVDFDRFKKMADFVSQHVADTEPEAGYEVFTDEPSGRVAFFETWPSEPALLKHVRWMVESKMVEQIPDCWVPERLSVLDTVTEPQLAEVLEQFGALELERISVVRPGGGGGG